MQVTYKSKKLEKVCTNPAEARKIYSERNAILITQRILEIQAADNVQNMIRFGVGRCHKLKGDRNGEYAVDLVHPKRLVFTVTESTIQIARIEEIVDYH